MELAAIALKTQVIDEANGRKTKNTRLGGPIAIQLQRVCHDTLDFIQVPGFPSAITLPLAHQ